MYATWAVSGRVRVAVRLRPQNTKELLPNLLLRSCFELSLDYRFYAVSFLSQSVVQGYNGTVEQATCMLDLLNPTNDDISIVEDQKTGDVSLPGATVWEIRDQQSSCNSYSLVKHIGRLIVVVLAGSERIHKSVSSTPLNLEEKTKCQMDYMDSTKKLEKWTIDQQKHAINAEINNGAGNEDLYYFSCIGNCIHLLLDITVRLQKILSLLESEDATARIYVVKVEGNLAAEGISHLLMHASISTFFTEVNAKDMISGGALWELVRISQDCSRKDIRALACQTLTSSSTFEFVLRRLRIEDEVDILRLSIAKGSISDASHYGRCIAFGDLNNLFSGTMSGITCCLRFSCQLNSDLRKLGSQQYIDLSHSTRTHSADVGHKERDVRCRPMPREVLDCLSHVPWQDEPKEVDEQMINMQNKNLSYFVEWIPQQRKVQYRMKLTFSVFPSPKAVSLLQVIKAVVLNKIVVLMRTRMIAVRDVLSSDPYVVLKLGKQRVQRAEADSNLNPVWNEELMLSVPQNYGPIKLEVYDYDTFSAGDVMGEVEIDIQSMITLPLCSWMLRSLRTCRSGDG
ncbi:hypothetical protein SASPL_130125 [Salvia splendens]|uniref:C2 domain-containing protein n=2 Tax=Salvia splendens TaxID=180675 RepID=A0A8X8ZJL7_SALSN|nr:hypothetical protein SASPL_130125 [Salvia splendens]